MESQVSKFGVHSLLEAMPIDKEANLIDHIDYFFTYSIGIIGLLKKWFKRAFVAGFAYRKAVIDSRDS